jgi:starch-binding outer membrane protein, SusD/RagB family
MKILNKYLLLLIISTLVMGGCSSILDPDNDNHNTFNRVYVDPAFAEGLLMDGYNKIPTIDYLNSTSPMMCEVATDNAVANDKFNNFLRVGTGQWTAQYNPLNVWDNCNKGIMYVNEFMTIIDTVKWSWNNPNISRMFKDRLKGESYAIRGLLRYYMLRNHSGKSNGGTLLGVKLLDEFLQNNSNFNVPRAGFTESVAAINADFDMAMKYLPMDFLDITLASQLPAEYTGYNIADYNKVMGSVSNQRITKRIILGFKARVALLAASQAFNTNNDQTLWGNAADAAAVVLNGIGGIAGLDPNGHKFYESARVEAVTVAADQKEMLWRGFSNNTSSNFEKNNLPPGLYGNGLINPSQNLVDAFPMANGYPIKDPLSLYIPANPYAGRDPRLAAYIIYNGATFQSKVIKTGLGGGVNAKDSLLTSTRTGYYLKKLLRDDVIFQSNGSTTAKKHYSVHMRYTEIFLNYAEAANEAWGPTGKGTVANFSAKDVIAAIRKRAGLPAVDAYLNSITTKDAMRDLIRNERRLELCFEGFRFWDLRRWGLPLTTTVGGVNIDKAGTTFQYVDIEPRTFFPYMQYGPIPEQEVLKFPALEQNAGW